MSDSLFRAIFYQKNPAAARTKFSAGAHPSSSSDSFPASDRRGPQFPTSGWSSRTDDLPKVTVATVVGHLVKTGKAVPNVQGEDEITVVQKPLERGHAFFSTAMCMTLLFTETKNMCLQSQNAGRPREKQ